MNNFFRTTVYKKEEGRETLIDKELPISGFFSPAEGVGVYLQPDGVFRKKYLFVSNEFVKGLRIGDILVLDKARYEVESAKKSEADMGGLEIILIEK